MRAEIMARIVLELKHERPELSGTVEWDEETGALSGPLADQLRSMAESAAAAGNVTSDPYPSGYKIGRDPLRNRRDLALIISSLWRVPEVLHDALPLPDDQGETDVEIVN